MSLVRRGYRHFVEVYLGLALDFDSINLEFQHQKMWLAVVVYMSTWCYGDMCQNP